jgi:hypothetical protein
LHVVIKPYSDTCFSCEQDFLAIAGGGKEKSTEDVRSVCTEAPTVVLRVLTLESDKKEEHGPLGPAGKEMVGMVLLLRRYQLLCRLLLPQFPCLLLNSIDIEHVLTIRMRLGRVIAPCLCADRKGKARYFFCFSLVKE